MSVKQDCDEKEPDEAEAARIVVVVEPREDEVTAKVKRTSLDSVSSAASSHARASTRLRKQSIKLSDTTYTLESPLSHSMPKSAEQDAHIKRPETETETETNEDTEEEYRPTQMRPKRIKVKANSIQVSQQTTLFSATNSSASNKNTKVKLTPVVSVNAVSNNVNSTSITSNNVSLSDSTTAPSTTTAASSNLQIALAFSLSSPPSPTSVVATHPISSQMYVFFLWTQITCYEP